MRALLYLLVLILVLPASAAERPWRSLQAQNYTVLSQLEDRDTISWARDFDQFIATIAVVSGINPKALPPLTIVLFDRDKDFESYKIRRPDGRAANVAGQFVRRPSWSLIALADEGDKAGTRSTIYHEATHWLTSGDPRRQPAWFDEGLAEMFSTYERKFDTVSWGHPIQGHLETMNLGGMIPFDEFLTRRSAQYDRDSHTERFYAQSWSFVHFLLWSGDPSRRAKMFEFTRLYASNSADVAVNQAFGKDLSVWEDALSSYVRQRRFGFMKQPVQPVPPLPPPTDASPALVEAVLGMLALSIDNIDLSSSHARRGLELDPGQPRVHELLTYIAQETKDTDAMGKHARDAARLGSKDPTMFLVLGDSYARGLAGGTKDASMKRVHAYENAINLNPMSYLAYERLMMALYEAGDPTVEDMKFFSLGLKAFPDDDWLKVGQARLAARQGRKAEAGALMETALRDGSSLDGAQRDFALQIRQHWEQEANLEQLSMADEQISSGRKAEARALLDKLLAREDLPAELQQQAQKLRAGL